MKQLLLNFVVLPIILATFSFPAAETDIHWKSSFVSVNAGLPLHTSEFDLVSIGYSPNTHIMFGATAFSGGGVDENKKKLFPQLEYFRMSLGEVFINYLFTGKEHYQFDGNDVISNMFFSYIRAPIALQYYGKDIDPRIRFNPFIDIGISYLWQSLGQYGTSFGFSSGATFRTPKIIPSEDFDYRVDITNSSTPTFYIKCIFGIGFKGTPYRV